MLKLLRKASRSLSGEQDSLKSSSTKSLKQAALTKSDQKKTTEKQEAQKDATSMPLGKVYANGSAVDAFPTPKEPLVHLTLVLDVSESMRGDPLRALGRCVKHMLKHLQPWESLTIWMFSSKVSRPIHCEAGSFPGNLNEVARNMKADKGSQAVFLFDAIEQAVEELEARGEQRGVIKPLLVFTDYHSLHGKADAHDAKRALLWCNVPNVHPCLISCGDPRTFLDVRSVASREISVGGTDNRSIQEAIEVAGEWLQKILRGAGIPDPADSDDQN